VKLNFNQTYWNIGIFDAEFLNEEIGVAESIDDVISDRSRTPLAANFVFSSLTIA
jgi:hypothetical protein